MLALIGTKLKGNGEVAWCGVNGLITSVQKIKRDWGGVAVLMNDEWHSAVVDLGCVSSRILCSKFMFPRVIVCLVVGYGHTVSITRERLWDDLDRAVDRVDNGYRVCMLGNLNKWVGNRVKVGTTGAFGVPGENDNGRRVVERDCVCNINFEHKNLPKYTRVARDQAVVEVKCIIDLILVKKYMLHYVRV